MFIDGFLDWFRMMFESEVITLHFVGWSVGCVISMIILSIIVTFVLNLTILIIKKMRLIFSDIDDVTK